MTRMNKFRFIVGVLAIALLAFAPTTVHAAKHRQRGKSSSTHSRGDHASKAELKRRGHEASTKRRAGAAKTELNEIERRWSEENVEPELPE